MLRTTQLCILWTFVISLSSCFWLPNLQRTTEETIFLGKNESAVYDEEPTVLEDFEDNLEFRENDTISLETEQSTKEIEPVEENKTFENIVSTTGVSPSKMDEKIVLPRNNCNLEIVVDDIQDINIQIKFEPLKSKSDGKCYITLNGYEKSKLGVLISDIKLYHNGSGEEILKVIVSNTGMDFVLKEYNSGSEYQPLLLTETHRVYLVLYYNITTAITNEEYSHFNLQVFSYHKYENSINKNDKHKNGWTETVSSHLPIRHKIENIFFTTENSQRHVPYFK